MTHYRLWLAFILLITAIAVWIDMPDNPGLEIGTDETDPDAGLNLEFEVVQGLDLQGGLRILLTADIPSDQYDDESMDIAADIINQRVNGIGLVDATVQRQGEERILVELPGVSDPDLALNAVKNTGQLEFVDFSAAPAVPAGTCILTDEAQRRNEANAAADPDAVDADTGPCPDGSFPIGVNGQENGQPYPVARDSQGRPLLGTILDDARAEADEFGQWRIAFDLTDEGSDIFADYTNTHQGQQMAIVLDGVVLSAPVIQARISDSGVITGDFTRDEADVLAAQLRYGALPVPLTVDSFDNVGPTLGEISVERSIRAGIIGVIVVLVFMATYYRVPGVAAALALLVFGAINFALYKAIPVTLTLPAITGFLISIGTAVDGNILIFERMKEELRAGRSLERAVNLGFERAWTAIRDSNISTILICGVLFFFGRTFGASAVQGFAITLALGLTINLFTAVIVTRTFLATMLDVFGNRLRGNRRLMGA
jgi:protein-export membrane protein SecD